MERDFKFDAPKFFRFTNVSIHQDITSIDPDDNRDLWFMAEHPEISPSKQIVQPIIVPQIQPQTSVPEPSKKKQLKRREIRKISKPKEKKIQYQLKRHHSQQSKINKVNEHKKKQKNKSCQVHRIKRPCPFPLRVQRNWETKSKKKWYQLTEESAKKALESMKKETKKTKQTVGKNSKRSFKF